MYVKIYIRDLTDNYYLSVKATLNRCVFKTDLNLSRDDAFLISPGSVFGSCVELARIYGNGFSWKTRLLHKYNEQAQFHRWTNAPKQLFYDFIWNCVNVHRNVVLTEAALFHQSHCEKEIYANNLFTNDHIELYIISTTFTQSHYLLCLLNSFYNFFLEHLPACVFMLLSRRQT